MSQGKGSKRRNEQIDSDEMECNWQYAFKRESKNDVKIRHKKKLRKAPNE
jgi:hypothetical protein